MKWIKLSVASTREASDLIADVLFNLGSSGVSIIDPNDINDLIKGQIIWDYIDENLFKKSNVVEIQGFYPIESKTEKLEQLNNELEKIKSINSLPLGSLEITCEEIDDTDWFNEWKKYYKPIDCGRIVVVPQWINYKNDDNKVIVKINPGAAFGTGEHETTRMCLEFLSQLDLKNLDVLDVGTGSGILANACALSGAKSITSYDIDPVAVKSARENAELNGITKIRIFESDLIKESDIKADLILANITADILIRLSKGIKAHLRKNGMVIISGIIHKRKDEVIKAFIDAGLKVKEEKISGEWIAYLLD